MALGSKVARIEQDSVTLADENGEQTIDNDAVFTMIGREAPLEFFRRSGLPILNEWTWWRVLGCAAFVLFCFGFYHWKNGAAPEFRESAANPSTRSSRAGTGFHSTCPDGSDRSSATLAEVSNREGQPAAHAQTRVG